MIGLVLVTHGRLAHEFVAAMEHIVGPQGRVASIAIGPDDDMDLRRREIIAAVEANDAGRGVVVLTDMFGGTPSNLSIGVMNEGRVEVVAGMNLPLLIKLAQVRAHLTLREAVEAAQTAGRNYIRVASQELSGAGT